MDRQTLSAIDAFTGANGIGNYCLANNQVVDTATIAVPDELVLQLHRYLWKPARYAHPEWFSVIGFKPQKDWFYGQYPELDRCLDKTLRAYRGTPLLKGQLNNRERRIALLAVNMPGLALALGLSRTKCSDYFLLPHYRRILQKWLTEDVIWYLFGLCGGDNQPVFSPKVLAKAAIEIGTAMLYRLAQGEPVLYAILIMLPPPRRKLWPVVSPLVFDFLEHELCPITDCH